MMVLRPKPSVGHRTARLTVVRNVCSRVYPDHWRKSGSTHTMCPTSGAAKVCDCAAWAHSIMVAAGSGRWQSAASVLLDLAKFYWIWLPVLLDLAKFYEHVGHDRLWEEGSQNKLPKATPGLLLRFLGGSSRQTSALPSGPFFLVAVAPPQPPN